MNFKLKFNEKEWDNFFPEKENSHQNSASVAPEK